MTSVVVSSFSLQQPQQQPRSRILFRRSGSTGTRSITTTTTTTTTTAPTSTTFFAISSSSSSVSSFNQQSLMDRVVMTSSSSSSSSKSKSKAATKTNFPQTWVPLCSVYELDGSRPNSVYFFGQEYIIYQSQNQQREQQPLYDGTDHAQQPQPQPPSPQSAVPVWCCIDPTCPHRLAPLREGRIVPNTSYIQCSYHGWTFDGIHNNNNNTTTSSNCVDIPQLSSSSSSINNNSNHQQQQQRILNHPSCQVQSYPCVVEKNILWVWLWGPSLNNNNDNALMYTHLPEYYLNHLPSTTTTTFTRIVPYSYDVLIENIMDISHVPFAHHTLQGTRSDVDVMKPIVNATMSPLPSPYSLLSSSSPHASTTTSFTTTGTTNASSSSSSPPPPASFEDGFMYHFMDATRNMTRLGNCTFKAPYMVHYNADFVVPPSLTTTDENDIDNDNNESAKPKPFALTTLLIPVSAGYSKIIIINSVGTAASPSSESSDSSDTDPTRTPNSNKNIGGITSNASNAVEKVEKKKRIKTKQKQSIRTMIQRMIFQMVFPRLPIWFLHSFSNRFLDSDLLLLHDQETALQQRRQRRQQLLMGQPPLHNDNDDTDVSKFILEQYFMPSKADRSIVMIRKWISQYASAVYDLSDSDSSNTVTDTTTTTMQLPPQLRLPPLPPYTDRAVLFDRYHQHTRQCKYCSTMLHVTLPKYKRYSTLLLSLGILLWNIRHATLVNIVSRLLCIGSILSFPIYNSIEHMLRYGDFDHSKNH